MSAGRSAFPSARFNTASSSCCRWRRWPFCASCVWIGRGASWVDRARRMCRSRTWRPATRSGIWGISPAIFVCILARRPPRCWRVAVGGPDVGERPRFGRPGRRICEKAIAGILNARVIWADVRAHRASSFPATFHAYEMSSPFRIGFARGLLGQRGFCLRPADSWFARCYRAFRGFLGRF